jgi:pimeloyl-ACP methyl ester carboxylesterase
MTIQDSRATERAVAVAAERTDADTAGVVRTQFFGTANQLFGIMNLPSGPPSSGVVICSPFGSEHIRNYRNQFLLAAKLSERGMAVHRFDYAGTGLSEGEPSRVTFDGIVDDAIRAAERLAEVAQISQLAFVGLRLGGLVAAFAASRVPGAPVVLWQPCVDGGTFFREILRWLPAEDRIGVDVSDRGLLEAVSDRGSVEVFGFPVFAGTWESARGRSLEESLDGQRRVLLVQIGRREELRHEFAEVLEAWRSRGVEVESHVEVASPWWIPSARLDEGEVFSGHKELIRRTEAWLAGALPTEASP